MNKVLAIIPARSGSKRIPNKNIKNFCGKPLIAYTIEQALKCDFADRVIVDTDSPKIARVAKKYGAEVPYLRPKHLASDKAKVMDAIIYLLDRLKKEEKYEPTHILLLQATSPLRELEDIKKCWKLTQTTSATTVLTVCSVNPWLCSLNKNGDISLICDHRNVSTNLQALPEAYVLNGCFAYVVSVPALRRERKVITDRTKAVVCDRWRSVDLDEPEDWAVGELLYKNRKKIKNQIKKT